MRPAFILLLLIFACHSPHPDDGDSVVEKTPNAPFVVVLGTVQDAGSPHIGCARACCLPLIDHPDPQRKVTSLGIVDPGSGKAFLVEATPDMPEQLSALGRFSGFMENGTPDGIFITHAHIGHYTGLMYLGREALGSSDIPVYVMPEMKAFLESNGPWNQLVTLENVRLMDLQDGRSVRLTSTLSITPFLVPHRDEYSETVGYRIEGPGASLLFIPDINKWHLWEKDIRDEIRKADYALIDGSFFDGDEIGYRDVSEIPHPFISESIEYLEPLSRDDRNKVYFIHFNHTNPVLAGDQQVQQIILDKGFRISTFHQILKL